MQFRRNLLEAVEPIERIRDELGVNAESGMVGDARTVSLSYLNSETWSYDAEALKTVTGTLSAELEAFASAHPGELGSLEATFRTFKGPDFAKRSKNILRILPFLFAADGTPIVARLGPTEKAALLAKISAVDPNMLDNLYRDFFANHAKPLVEQIAARDGLGQLTAFLKNVQTDFIDGIVAKAVTPMAENGKAVEMRALSLERIPSYLAVIRGTIGGDCSLHSVPYFPLVKGSRTYWIRKAVGAKGQPQGYLFAVPVEIDGKVLPYVITVNGASLSKVDVERSIHAVAREWGVEEVVLPNFEFKLKDGALPNQYLVNTAAARDGLRFKGSVPINVELPHGWDVIAAELKRKPSGYKNYYDDNLRQAVVAKIPFAAEDKVVYATLTQPYRNIPDVTKIPKLEKAILAGGAVSKSTEAERHAVASILGLNESELKAGEILYGASIAEPINAEKFAILQRYLDFKLAQVLKLDPFTAIESLHVLSTENPTLGTPEEWSKLWASAASKLDRSYIEERAGVSASQRAAVLKTRAKVPPEFIRESAMYYLESPFPEDVEFALSHLKSLDPVPVEVVNWVEKKILSKDLRRLPKTSARDFYTIVGQCDFRSLETQRALLDALYPDEYVLENGRRLYIKAFVYNLGLSKMHADPALEVDLLQLTKSSRGYGETAGWQRDYAIALLGQLEHPGTESMFTIATAVGERDSGWLRKVSMDAIIRHKPTNPKVLEPLAKALTHAKYRYDVVPEVMEYFEAAADTNPAALDALYANLSGMEPNTIEALRPLFVRTARKRIDYQLKLAEAINYQRADDAVAFGKVLAEILPTDPTVQSMIFEKTLGLGYAVKVRVGAYDRQLQSLFNSDLLDKLELSSGVEDAILKLFKRRISDSDSQKLTEVYARHLLAKIPYLSPAGQMQLLDGLYYPDADTLQAIIHSFERHTPTDPLVLQQIKALETRQWMREENKVRFEKVRARAAVGDLAGVPSKKCRKVLEAV
jgi:hypothetical protein